MPGRVLSSFEMSDQIYFWNIFLFLVGFGQLLSKWLNFTKTMETEQNWVDAVKHDFAMQLYSNIQIECWKANLLVLIKIIPIKINQKFENILPIDNNLAIENVESIIHCEYIHRV